MIFKFYQLYRSMKEVVGIEVADKLFPEYNSLPDKMSPEDQAELARVLMKRLDEQLDKNTVLAIRMKHPCGIPKEYKPIMKEIKDNYVGVEDRIKAFAEMSGNKYQKISEQEYIFTWGLKKCVCGMFRKLENYEPISPTWCQCCNGHNKMLIELLLSQEVKSDLLEGICCGGKVCSFKITI